MNSKRKALIVVDVQRDFMPNGSLAVKNGNDIILGINKLLNSKLFALKIASKDAHPKNHCSFKENGGMWPDHCIKGTPGFEFAKGLDSTKIDYTIEKGTNPQIDSYSAFYDDGKVKTELDGLLKTKGIKKLFITGVALDYCVKATALDAMSLGYKTYIIRDLTKPIDINNEKQMIKSHKFKFIKPWQIWFK